MSGEDAKRALIITNPESGNGRGPGLAERAGDALRAEGWEAEVAITECPGDATQITREQAASFEIVFSCGGDGTLNEVVSGIVEHDTIVGVIPAGPANDLARAAGISLRPGEAIANLADGRAREIDLLEIGGGEAWSVVAVGMGIDARTVERAERLGEPLVGRSSYLRAVFAELEERMFTWLSVEVDGERWEGDALLVQVANCPNHGGRFKVAPAARIDDGLLNVVLVERMPPAEALKLVPLVYAGRHLDLPEVRRWTGEEVTLSQPDGAPVIIDGEIDRSSSLEIRVAPGRLRLWVPRAAASGMGFA